MGKKTKSTGAAVKKEITLDDEVVQQLTNLKNEGNKMFAKKDYTRAIEQYEQAIKLLPEGAADKSDLMCNKAACFYQLKRYKDAVKECSNALAMAPNSSKALLRRARSYEQQGLFKQALTDVQVVNRGDGATEETKEAEKRLKDVLAGRRPSLANGGATRASASSTAPPRPPRNGFPYYFTAKCSYQGEVRLVHMSAAVTYVDLLAAVKTKFPEAGPFMLKWVDKDGDSVTLTSKADVQNALSEVVSAVAGNAKAMQQGHLPPLRIQVVPVASEADVPQPPVEELLEREALLAQQRALQAKQAARRGEEQAANPTTATTPSGEVIEIDDWLIDFANLFRDMTGIDPDRHIDFHNEGWDKCTKAMDVALASEQALPLFDKAAERFRDVTCTGLLNWGNVHVCVAHKYLDEAASAASGPGSSDNAASSKATAEFDAAEKRYREALAHNEQFFDGLCAMGQLEFERAKLRAGLAVKPVRGPTPEEGASAAEQEAVQQAAAKAATEALKEALTRVTKESVAAAKASIDTANEWFKKALEAAVAADEKKRREDAEKAAEKAKKAGGSGSAADGKEAAASGAAQGSTDAAAATTAPKNPLDPEFSLKSQAQIMHGNVLYEWSQIMAAVEGDWRPMLDQAVASFTDAGCNAGDIRNALKNHTQVEHIDLGPEPEPAPAATPVPAAEPKPAAPEAKGLPSLEVKAKKKATTAAAARTVTGSSSSSCSSSWSVTRVQFSMDCGRCSLMRLHLPSRAAWRSRQRCRLPLQLRLRSDGATCTGGQSQWRGQDHSSSCMETMLHFSCSTWPGMWVAEQREGTGCSGAGRITKTLSRGCRVILRLSTWLQQQLAVACLPCC